MCLSTKMSAKKKAEFEGQTEGWKVLFSDRTGGLVGDNYAMSAKRPIGEWLNEGKYRFALTPPSFDNDRKYRVGWHIWLTLKGAENWKGKNKYKVIRKVNFRKPVAYGWQCNKPVVVAKEMMILKGGNDEALQTNR